MAAGQPVFTYLSLDHRPSSNCRSCRPCRSCTLQPPNRQTKGGLRNELGAKDWVDIMCYIIPGHNARRGARLSSESHSTRLARIPRAFSLQAIQAIYEHTPYIKHPANAGALSSFLPTGAPGMGPRVSYWLLPLQPNRLLFGPSAGSFASRDRLVVSRGMPTRSLRLRVSERE